MQSGDSYAIINGTNGTAAAYTLLSATNGLAATYVIVSGTNGVAAALGLTNDASENGLGATNLDNMRAQAATIVGTNNNGVDGYAGSAQAAITALSGVGPGDVGNGMTVSLDLCADGGIYRSVV